MKKEFWKNINGYNKYLISNYGRIKSKARNKRWSHHGKCGFYKTPEIILSPISTQTGYPQVNLYRDNGQYKALHIHRLMAETFIPNPENKPQVNHINGIKTDFRLENLEWATRSEQMKHAYQILKIKNNQLGKFGKEHPTSKAVIQMNVNGKVIKKWDCALDAVKKHKFDSGQISRCCNGLLKTHKGYKWKFA